MPVMVTNEDGEPLGIEYPEYDSEPDIYDREDFADYDDSWDTWPDDNPAGQPYDPDLEDEAS